MQPSLAARLRSVERFCHFRNVVLGQIESRQDARHFFSSSCVARMALPTDATHPPNSATTR